MTVVNDILDLTRMETGQMKLTLEPVQIETVCDRAIKQARAIQHNTSFLRQVNRYQNTLDHRFTLLIEPSLEVSWRTNCV